jgi:hypothetical protein
MPRPVRVRAQKARVPKKTGKPIVQATVDVFGGEFLNNIFDQNPASSITPPREFTSTSRRPSTYSSSHRAEEVHFITALMAPTQFFMGFHW